MRVLFIEDDRMIGESVLDQMRHEGFAVDWVRDGDAACQAFENESYDLVVLDLGLPLRSGMYVLHKIRASKKSTPVLIASANDAIDQRVKSLNAGADDYLVKPYDLNELFARMRALIRRSFGRSDAIFLCRNISINTTTKEVLLDGSSVPISSREWAVLEALVARPGAILSRSQLEDKLFAWKDDINSNAVEVYIHGLRKKLGTDVIKTVRGMGYFVAKE